MNNIIETLQKEKILYLENDKELSNLDLDNLEFYLGDLRDYNIEYIFDVYSKNIKETLQKISEYKYILLNTSFIGKSFDLFYQFILLAKKNHLKDKIIINCASYKLYKHYFDTIHKLLGELIQNDINFYISVQSKLIKYELNKNKKI